MTRSGSTPRLPRSFKRAHRYFRVPTIVAIATLFLLGGPSVVAQAQHASAAAARFGALKICKVAGPGVAVGTPFKFSFGAKFVTVPAGPAPGGSCVLAASNITGGSVAIKEITTGYRVTSITTNGQIGSLNLSQGTVTVFPPRTGPGITEVTYTNTHIARGQQTGYIEICKKLDALIPPGTYPIFSFTVQTQPIAVLAGACSPAIQVIAGAAVAVTETTPGNMTDCNTVPTAALVSCDIANRTATVNVAPGQISSETILTVTNCISDVGGGSACGPGPNVCPKIDAKLTALSQILGTAVAPPTPPTATPAFQKEAQIALQDGCVVYTSSLDLYLEFIRGGAPFVGQSILIGPLATTPPGGLTNFFNDIALSSDGTLYGVDGSPSVGSSLYTIARATATATSLGQITNLSGVVLNSLVVASDGKIWAAGGPNIYTIALVGGVPTATLVGSTLPSVAAGDLAFTGNDANLYMTAFSASGDRLAQLNPVSGAQVVLASGPILADHAFGLVSSYGALFAVMSPNPALTGQFGKLVAINRITGTGLQLGQTDNSHIVGGMASPPDKA